MTFSDNYKNICKPVEEYIKLLQDGFSTLYTDNSEVDTDIKIFLNSPAKHIRAVMTFLYLKSVGIEIDEKQITYQTIIELIHNASLIHDDIIDNAETRRNIPSLNKKNGNHIAVIGGDLLLSTALKEISKLNNPCILNTLANTFSKMCYGEINQYTNKYKIPSIDEYIKKTYMKTGILFECSLVGALTLANYNDKTNAENFAKYFGIAFQMNNDIKNIIENKPNNDIQSGIYTASVIFSKDPDNPLLGIEKAKILLDNYLSNAKLAIGDIHDNIYKRALLDLAELIKL